jgi:ubiquinone/menaquinone biosynthesis C-methylase UbiE
VIGVVLLLLAVVAVCLFVYWLLVLTEGAYLGPRVVTRLYDWGAPSYDRIKDFDSIDDARALAIPLVTALRGVRKPLVLDVATGTGRLPLALLRNLEFEGSIFGLDISWRMLEEASRKGARYQNRLAWLWKDGLDLPFGDSTFDAVCCLEALEFVGDASQAVKEMARVLRAGGTMLTSNRIGFDALLMPGRTFSKEEVEALLGDLSFDSVNIERWQTYYDLVWARKHGVLSPREGTMQVEDVVCCPSCREPRLSARSAGYWCEGCGRVYPVQRGIICLERPGEAQGQPSPVGGRWLARFHPPWGRRAQPHG